MDNADVYAGLTVDPILSVSSENENEEEADSLVPDLIGVENRNPNGTASDSTTIVPVDVYERILREGYK